MKIDPRIPEPVQPIFKDYLRLTEQRLVGLIDASYVVGSIALGEFNEHFSDIDFITVLSRKATPIELGHLRTIHQSIEKRYPKWKMSGSYIQASDLGKLGNDLRLHPQFHDGKLYVLAKLDASAKACCSFVFKLGNSVGRLGGATSIFHIPGKYDYHESKSGCICSWLSPTTVASTCSGGNLHPTDETSYNLSLTIG